MTKFYFLNRVSKLKLCTSKAFFVISFVQVLILARTSVICIRKAFAINIVAKIMYYSQLMFLVAKVIVVICR